MEKHNDNDDLFVFVPKELVSEILLRLPWKSRGLCKCVCKSWCSIINTFPWNLYLLFDTTTYGSRSTASRKFTIPRISYDKVGAVQTLNPDPLVSLELGQINYHISCICNGLIMFCGGETKWLLWNPTTQHTKLLPSSSSQTSISMQANRRNIHYQNVGFGFDIKTMDYKVVMIYNYNATSPRSLVVEMYSLKTDSWKIIATFSQKVLRIRDCLHDDLHEYSSRDCSCGVFSNGMLSWRASYNEEDWDNDQYTNAIISVDLSSETIITTPLPSSITHINNPPSNFKNNYCLVYQESLALVHWFAQAHKRSFDIWVLGEYGVKESWKKLFTIGPLGGIARVLGFLGYGKVFVQTYQKRKFVTQLQRHIYEKQVLLLDTLNPTQRRLQIFRGDYKKVLTYKEESSST